MLHVIYNSRLPFITSGIDLAKLDLRSGLERLTYSIIIILVATMFAWIMALLFKATANRISQTIHMSKILLLVLKNNNKFFCGVFGF